MKGIRKMTDILSTFVSIARKRSEFTRVLNDYGGQGLNLERAEVVHFDKRIILRVPVKGSGRNIFVKIRLKNKAITNDPGLISDTRNEFDLLKRVWEKIQGSPVEGTVSEPLCCGVKDPVIFLGECPGMDFEHYLNRILFRHGRDGILSRARLSGEWLGRYHSLFSEAEGKEDSKIFLAGVEDILSENVETLTPFLKSALLQTARDRILSRFKEYKKNIKTGFIHNNYSLRNIIFENDKIGVIDFEGAGRGLFYYDIGTLMSEIEMKGRFPAYSRSFVASMKMEFLLGYSAGFPIKEAVASAFTSFFMLSYLANTLRRTHFSAAEKVNTRFKLLFLKNWLSNFCING